MKIALIFAGTIIFGYWYHINSQTDKPLIYHRPSANYAVPIAAIVMIVLGLLL